MRKPIYEMTPKHSHFTENYDIKIWGEVHGGMVCSVHHFAPGTDITPSFEALGGFCPVPHWGYCFKGEAIMRYSDGTEEVVRAGDMFYFPKGHTMIIDKNAPVACEFIQFSVAADFGETEDAIAKAAKK
jgi:hypothetical protein